MIHLGAMQHKFAIHLLHIIIKSKQHQFHQFLILS